jgi:hypothetical protein
MARTEVQFKRLNDGNWGLVGPRMATGERVKVHKKDGSTVWKTVGKIIWTDRNDGTTIATIDESGESGESRTPTRHTPLVAEIEDLGSPF